MGRSAWDCSQVLLSNIDPSAMIADIKELAGRSSAYAPYVMHLRVDEATGKSTAKLLYNTPQVCKKSSSAYHCAYAEIGAILLLLHSL